MLSDKCAHCQRRETIQHVLNGPCKPALDQKRFDHRHDSILLHVNKQTRANKEHSGKRIIADLADFRLPDGGTVPPERFVTLKKPDIVMIDDKNNTVELFELTSCADSERLIAYSQSRKRDSYTDIRRELKASLKVFEVCSLGNIPKHARETIQYLVGKKVARETFKALSKIAISCSYYLFNRRRDRDWNPPPLFERPIVDLDVK